MGALSLLFLVLLDPGDEILIQDPQWLNYVAQVRYCGGEPVRVPTDLEHNFLRCSPRRSSGSSPRIPRRS